MRIRFAVFYFLILSLLISHLGCGSTNSSREWFRTFFVENAKEPDNSKRIFMLWFAGDRQAYTKEIWLGGSADQSVRFFSQIELLLEGQREANVGDSTFLLELVLDMATVNNQAEKLRSLSRRFPNTFRVTMIDSIPADRLPPKDVVEHAHIGNPVIASDALRLWYLRDKDYATNVYIDVDHFMDKADNLDRYGDHKLFGREVADGAVYHSPNNNDYLIDKRTPDQKLDNIKKRAEGLYQDQARLFNHYKNRSDFVVNPSSSKASATYWPKVLDLVNFQMAHPDKFVNIVGAIIRTGPSLWNDSSYGNTPDAFVNKAMTDAIVSAQAWKGGGAIPIGHQTITVNTLNTLKIVDAFEKANLTAEKKRISEIILTLNLMGWDHNYFSRFPNNEIGPLLAEKIDELRKEATALVKAKLPNASMSDFSDDLKQATGGIYLALTAE